MEKRSNIKEWAEEDRPREKLMSKGAGQLTSAELLAILIGSGSADETAVELMRRVLGDCNGKLKNLGTMTIDDLTQYKGLGPAKAVSILAACELGRRRQAEAAEERKDMSSPDAIYQLLQPKMENLDVEEAWVVLLNQNYRLLSYERISHGGISETAVDVRVILKKAILNNATVLVLCHNHPSNNPTPSGMDDQITERMRKACDIMRIYFLDHLIITNRQYYSYREHGKL